MNAKIARVGVLAIVTWSCAGDGTGLDEYEPAEFQMSATLSSIVEGRGSAWFCGESHATWASQVVERADCNHPRVDCWWSAGKLD